MRCLAILFFFFVSNLAAQTPTFVLNPPGHHSRINRILVTNDKATIITFGDDKSICFWDVTTRSLLKKRWLDIGQGEAGRIIDADLGEQTNLLAIARINAAGKPVVQLIDIELDKVLGTYEGFSQELGFVRIDPNEKFILTGSYQLGNYNSEAIRLWKIPPRSANPFLIDKPSAQTSGTYVHDLCFFDYGSKVLITALSFDNVVLEINHDPGAIPEYSITQTVARVKYQGHVKPLPDEEKVLFATHEGIIYKIDQFDSREVVLRPSGWKRNKLSDTTILEVFVSPSQKIGLTINSREQNKTHSYFYELFDIEEKKIIRQKAEWFNYVHFLSDTLLVGIGEHGLFTFDIVNDSVTTIFPENGLVSEDEIQFGDPAKIAFDDLNYVFDFRLLELVPAEELTGFSMQKTSYEGVPLSITNDKFLKVGEKLTWFFPTDDDISAYSFLNNGKIVAGRRGYRSTRNSLLLYDTNKPVDKSNVAPELAFEGSMGGIISLAPAPIEKGLLFASRDRFGVLSIWSEASEQFEIKFKNHLHYWPFLNFNLEVDKRDEFAYALPRPGYAGTLKAKDRVISLNEFTPRKKADIIPYLETLDPAKPVTITAQRKGVTVTDQLTLNKLKYVSPLLSFSRFEGNEWICWTPQGYYAASTGGEKFGGWVINKGMNEFAEFHPMYDFKKQFYRPELLKLIATEGSFRKAVELYNTQAEQPIGADGSITEKLPPSITWLNPVAVDTVLSKNTVRLTARVSSSTSLQGAKILLNGRTVLRRDQISIRQEKGSPNYVVTFEMDLPSLENTINLFAENENGSSVSEERVLRLKQLETGIEKYKPNLYLLSVGVSAHSLPGYSLNFADKDATAISSMYEAQKGMLFKNVFTRTLVNEQATRANILEAFYWLEQNVTQKDVAIIFIASHGLNEKDKFYILPHDGDPERIRITGVDWFNFSDVLGNLPSKVLVFIDACHSGKLGTNLLAKRGETDLMEAIRALATEENGVVIMAASTGKESSFESVEWQHGAFTLALLEGMRDGQADLNEDGIINIREIDYYVAERVKKLTQGKQHPTTQKPSVVSEFPLLQIKKP